MDIEEMTVEQVREHLQKLEAERSSKINEIFEAKLEAIFTLIEDLAKFKEENVITHQTQAAIVDCMDQHDLIDNKEDRWSSSNC
jgi:hypothetical protein